MDPIALTAYYCCGVRAEDARSAKPMCGDSLAERFMGDEGKKVFERFKGLKEPNASNAARHRLVDDLVRERLKARPDTLVVLPGAGFDTRAFRLQGGRWVELDQAAVIARKEQVLPSAQAPNSLTRIPIDFAKERLADKLAPWTGTRDALVVMEGVSMYLTPENWRDTTEALHRLLPGHTLVCDLTTATFTRRFSGRIREEIRALGGDFSEPRDDPLEFVSTLGYTLKSAQSIVGAAMALGGLRRMPDWLFNALFRSLRDGYRVAVFEASPSSTKR